MNLILILPEETGSDGCVTLTDQRAVHIRKVLRASPGKTLRIGLLNGPFGCGTVEAVSTESVTLSCEWESAVPPRPAMDLLLAMPRPKVLKRLWAQLAALGVGRIFLTNAEKVERFYFDTHVLDPDFYTARLVEGLQQARDTLLPEVTVVKQLKPFLESEPFPTIGKKFLADPSGERSLFQTLENGNGNFPMSGKRVLLAIGPEGGWTPYELQMFKEHGFDLFGMGSRILRTDTACIGLSCLLAEILRKGV
jgi:RsmE family RNA methyltransferase